MAMDHISAFHVGHSRSYGCEFERRMGRSEWSITTQVSRCLRIARYFQLIWSQYTEDALHPMLFKLNRRSITQAIASALWSHRDSNIFFQLSLVISIMGTCNQALLSYGIVISESQALALLKVLRSSPPAPEDSTSWSTDKNDKLDEWKRNYGSELNGRIRSLVREARVEYDELQVRTLGAYDEWEGLAIFFDGIYDKEDDGGGGHGILVDFWGRDEGMTRVKRIVSKPWEDEEFMTEAKAAFTRLAGLPSFKEADVDVDPDWLVVISVG